MTKEKAEQWAVCEPYEGCEGRMGWHVCAGEDADVIVAECPGRETAEQIVRDHNHAGPVRPDGRV